MGSLSKKPTCPICGGKITWLLSSKIEDEYICFKCHNKLDIENDKADNLTMQGLREYLEFYDQNQLLKDQFVISQRVDFCLWDINIIFDYQNKLFCMSRNPDKTIFEGKHLKSFIIKEDNVPLFEGSVEGIRRYASTVPERAMAMFPQIAQFMMNRQMARAIENDGRDNGAESMQYFDLPEPFQTFNVELHFDHPYWTVIKYDMDGPRFDNNLPDVDDYVCTYQRSMEEIEKLMAAFTAVAFPEAPEQLWCKCVTDGT